MNHIQQVIFIFFTRTETPFNPIDGPIEAHRWPSQLFPMGIDGPSMAIDGIWIIAQRMGAVVEHFWVKFISF